MTYFCGRFDSHNKFQLFYSSLRTIHVIKSWFTCNKVELSLVTLGCAVLLKENLYDSHHILNIPASFVIFFTTNGKSKHLLMGNGIFIYVKRTENYLLECTFRSLPVFVKLMC